MSMTHQYLLSQRRKIGLGSRINDADGPHLRVKDGFYLRTKLYPTRTAITTSLSNDAHSWVCVLPPSSGLLNQKLPTNELSNPLLAYSLKEKFSSRGFQKAKARQVPSKRPLSTISDLTVFFTVSNYTQQDANSPQPLKTLGASTITIDNRYFC